MPASPRSKSKSATGMQGGASPHQQGWIMIIGMRPSRLSSVTTVGSLRPLRLAGVENVAQRTTARVRARAQDTALTSVCVGSQLTSQANGARSLVEGGGGALLFSTFVLTKHSCGTESHVEKLFNVQQHPCFPSHFAFSPSSPPSLHFPRFPSASIFHHPSSTDQGIQAKHQGLQAVSVFFLLFFFYSSPSLYQHSCTYPHTLIPSSTAPFSPSSLDTSSLSSRNTSTNFNFLSPKLFPSFWPDTFPPFCKRHMQTHTS